MSGLGMSADEAGYRLQTLRIYLLKMSYLVLISAYTIVLPP